MIKASLILAFAYCIASLWKHRSAAERHILWVAAIGSAALLPLFSVVVPEWHLEIAGKITAVLPAIAQAAQGAGFGESSGVVIHANGIEPTNKVWPALLALWLIGSLVTMVLLFAGSLTLRRLAIRSRPVSDPAWFKMIAELTRALGIKRTLCLMQSTDSSMPLTWGIFRPRLLIPESSAGWSDERKRAVLVHELAHVSRWDWPVQILAELACVLYWFHPLFWIARNQLHLESERSCDDAAIRLGIGGQNYATHLIEIARALRKRSPTWSLAMARQFNLEKRLIAILNPDADRRALTRTKAITTVFALICFALPLAAIRADGPEMTLNSVAPPEAPDSIPSVAEYTIPPLYSDEARAMNIEGFVTVEVRIGVNGRAANLRVVKGLGFGLDENALLAVRDWRFVRGKRNGNPSDTILNVDVEFNLRNAELNEVIANDMATRLGPGIVPPRIVRRVDPDYPKGLLAGGALGDVMLDAIIQENGIPKVVRVIRSRGWRLDEAAIAALEQWRFSPASVDGTAVKVRMNVQMPVVAPKN